MTDVRQLFSNKVTEYVASRPDYPAALIDDLAELPVTEDMHIADVGAGTGIFTKSLLDRGWRVSAVEPNAAMRAAADLTLKAYPRYRSVAGSAEATTLNDQSIDLITAAQAFHWFDIERARGEWLRILRPQGQMALIWNDRLLTDPLQRDLEAVFADFGGAKRDVVLAHEDRSSVSKFFGSATVRKLTYSHEHRLDQEGLTSLGLSRSYMPARNTPEGQRAIDALSELFQRYMTAGSVTVRYKTVMSIGRPA